MPRGRGLLYRAGGYGQILTCVEDKLIEITYPGHGAHLLDLLGIEDPGRLPSFLKFCLGYA
jgi:hypothetical protein